jgi:hypothetical protein
MIRAAPVKIVRLILVLCSTIAIGAGSVVAQQAPARPAPSVTPPGQQAYRTPQAAFDALADAVRRVDIGVMQQLFGRNYREVVPVDPNDVDEARQKFLDAYTKGHKINMDGDSKAVLEVGDAGWTFPVPLVKRVDGWRFDMVAGFEEMKYRQIGRNELAVVQVLLAIVDAQQEYFGLDPLKTGTAEYARRLLSTPGKKDGLYWEQKDGDPESPLGELVAKAQGRGADATVGYYGYHYRMLYAQGQHAQGGAYQYIVNDRMIGGFAVIAWPVRYGETGVMTFLVNQEGVVFEKDLGPNTTAAAAQIKSFDPDKTWQKSDTSP